MTTFLCSKPIDNLHCGHSAQAVNAGSIFSTLIDLIVKIFMEDTEEKQGPDKAHSYWKRILRGYFLNFLEPPQVNSNAKERMLQIIKSKATYASGIYGNASLGGRTIDDWLDSTKSKFGKLSYKFPSLQMNFWKYCQILVGYVPAIPEKVRFLHIYVRLEVPCLKFSPKKN